MAVCIGVADGTGPESLPSNIDYFPLTAAGDTITLTWAPGRNRSTGGTDTLSTPKYWLYGCAVTRDAITGQFVHSTPMVNLTGHVAASWPTANGDGTYTITFDANIVALTKEPVIPITVSIFDDATQLWKDGEWLVDFQYEARKNGGGQVRLAPTSTVLDPSGTGGHLLKVSYYYDISRIRELPLDASGRNPILPITMDVLFPDMDSKLIWHFFKCQVNTNLRFAVSENDWYGQDFTCETLDDSNIHPAYGFGYIQVVGEALVDEIHKYNNLPYGLERVLSENQTMYA